MGHPLCAITSSTNFFHESFDLQRTHAPFDILEKQEKTTSNKPRHVCSSALMYNFGDYHSSSTVILSSVRRGCVCLSVLYVSRHPWLLPTTAALPSPPVRASKNVSSIAKCLPLLWEMEYHIRVSQRAVHSTCVCPLLITHHFLILGQSHFVSADDTS